MPTSQWSRSRVEHLDSNPHCHVLISASDDESAWLFGEGNKSWCGCSHAASFISVKSKRRGGNFLHHEGDLQAGLPRSAIYLPSAAFESAYRARIAIPHPKRKWAFGLANG